MEPKTEDKIRELLDFAKEHALSEMMYQDNGLRVAFRRDTKPKGTSKAGSKGDAEPKIAPVEEETLEIIRSPIVGTFRRSSSKDHPPVVLEGNHVKPGDRLGVVECMKIPTEVTSFSKGVIKKIMVEEGQVVEYGQPLFVVSPTDFPPINGKK